MNILDYFYFFIYLLMLLDEEGLIEHVQICVYFFLKLTEVYF